MTGPTVRDQLRAIVARVPRPRPPDRASSSRASSSRVSSSRVSSSRSSSSQASPARGTSRTSSSRAGGALASALLAALVRTSRQLREPRPPRWRRVTDVGNRWRSRPLLAAVLRLLVVLIPALCSLSATGLLAAGAPNPSSLPVRLLWWAVLLAVSTVVALVTERQTRRLLPLALLYKLTLLFPDEAPSRYRMARAAANPQRLQQLAAGSTPRSRAATHVLAWVAQLSEHDRHTRGHSERVRVFTDLLAEQLDITGIDRDKLRWAALLHDIGKLRVPARLLNKPSKPSASEWDVLRQHPAAGLELVGPLAEWLGPWAGGIVDHHERFDGLGYPNGLAGQQISISGRIVAVADAYETMTATRAYKKAMQAALARQELARCAGTHFDPVVVRAFLAIGLPRMLLGIGPLSFLLHLPFLSRLPEAGLGLASMAGQAATPVAAGLTAASMATAVVVAPAASVSTAAASVHATTSAPATTATRSSGAATSALAKALQQSPVVRSPQRPGASGTDAGGGGATTTPSRTTPKAGAPKASTSTGAPRTSARKPPGASAPTRTATPKPTAGSGSAGSSSGAGGGAGTTKGSGGSTSSGGTTTGGSGTTKGGSTSSGGSGTTTGGTTGGSGGSGTTKGSGGSGTSKGSGSGGEKGGSSAGATTTTTTSGSRRTAKHAPSG